MERYAIVKQIGEGTFGNVFLAVEKATGEKVRVMKEASSFLLAWLLLAPLYIAL